MTNHDMPNWKTRYRNKWRHQREVLRYSWRRQGTWIVLYACVLVAIAAIVWVGGSWLDRFVDVWGQAGAVLGLATLGITSLVWLGESRENWEESLPKRLSVVFEYVDENNQHHPVMICLDATLVGVADIRQMSQQIGMQINHGSQLQLIPQLDVSPPGLDVDQGVVRHCATLYVYGMPKRLQNKPANTGCVVDLSAGPWKVTEEPDMRGTLKRLQREGRI